MSIQSRLLILLDYLLKEASFHLGAPLISGRIKDFISLFFKQNYLKKYPYKLSKGININYDLIYKKGVIKFDALEIANQFSPYIKKYNEYNNFKGENYKKKVYFFNILNKEICLKTYREFLEIGYSQELVKKLSLKYGNLVFCGGGIYMSPPLNESEKLSGSQLWHLDGFSLNHFKVFINLNNIDNFLGPTKIITKDNTKDLIRLSSFRKITGKKVSNKVSSGICLNDLDLFKAIKNNCVSNIGPKGTALIANTSLCLHQGSINLTNQSRYVLIFHYSRWNRYRENLTNKLSTSINTRFL